MNVLVTGANGYIGRRLVAALLDGGHSVIALMRDKRRFAFKEALHPNLTIVEADLLEPESMDAVPGDVDAAYYLLHSMGSSAGTFQELESRCAHRFAAWANRSRARQIIYLGGIANDERLSRHLKSRLNVEEILGRSRVPLTVLRAAIIIGSGSASFEIIRDLVEKLPFMITPRWVKTKCQPIAIVDVIFYLQAALLHEESFDRNLDIGGPDVMTYRDMLLRYAKVRGLKRYIFDVPVFTPRLSSYWLYFITSTNYSLAKSLVDSMKAEVVCGDRHIETIVPHRCLSYEEALERALVKIENNQVLSSWKDAVVSGTLRDDYLDFVGVPRHGILRDVREVPVTGDVEAARSRVWSIGGQNGWYMRWAWEIRGFLDKLIGGVGLRRGRRNPHHLVIGDALDFWRVALTDKKRDHLVLFAEMKLPGEAWLEFEFLQRDGRTHLRQTATFRPKGLIGRLYWYLLVPVHFVIFRGMCRDLAQRPEPRARIPVAG
ncbi:SDR family oxidoreductase [Sulfidibacter corallicola]|uniref:SDR family oxidoreductase n=1 Tax=Sulfidibacter corallicola TaxID=2818388 RepID=A0A8A4TEC7_SULCO|nr:SDR family oxidoreductase [Sulfidibacter corallicola]QTD47973.1 SDR family oxidoreductase [Sulfidibacter corallicola]